MIATVTGPSTSEPVRAIAFAVSSGMVTASEFATGASSTGAMLIVTVAVSLAPARSVTW